MSEQEEDTRKYKVVINHEEQYSIWFAERDVPAGWSVVEIPDDWHEQYIAGLSKEEKDQPGKRNAWPTSRKYGRICGH